MSTMTLNLDDRHAAVLDKLATRNDMTKSQILRQALRLYQLVDVRAANGEQLAFTKDGVLVPVLIVGLPTVE